MGQTIEFKEKIGLTWGNMCYNIINLNLFQCKSLYIVRLLKGYFVHV
jgi:hypothetical protein